MNGRAAVYAARWTESVHLLQTSLCLGPHLLSRLIAKLWQTNFSSGCVCACVCVWRLRRMYLHIYSKIDMSKRKK